MNFVKEAYVVSRKDGKRLNVEEQQPYKAKKLEGDRIF
jgi:hypothetical protein